MGGCDDLEGALGQHRRGGLGNSAHSGHGNSVGSSTRLKGTAVLGVGCASDAAKERQTVEDSEVDLRAIQELHVSFIWSICGDLEDYRRGPG